MKSLSLLTVGVVPFVTQVGAWGSAGHEIAATIAQIHLHPVAVEKLCLLLPQYASCHLAPVATWADKVRRVPFYRWSAPHHYVGDITDHPGDHCVFGQGGWENPASNVLSAIQNTTTWLREGREGTEEALKFLIHFMGDMHMPLHLTGRDRGGNDMKVRFGGRTTNLHSVWDSAMIAKALRTIPRNYTRPLPVPSVEKALRDTIYDPWVRQIMWEGVMGRWKEDLSNWLLCPNVETPALRAEQNLFSLSPKPGNAPTDDSVVCPHHWSRPIHALNCEIIWPPSLDETHYIESLKSRYVELDTPEYAGKIKDQWILEKLLAMAGIRMAGILNYLLVDDPGLFIN